VRGGAGRVPADRKRVWFGSGFGKRREEGVLLGEQGSSLEVFEGVVVLGGVKDRARTRDFAGTQKASP